MDEGATPPPDARPSLNCSHTGASSEGGAGDISLETGMQDIALGGEEKEEVLQDVGLESPPSNGLSGIPSVPVSPSPKRGVRPAALYLDGDEEGDITSAGSPVALRKTSAVETHGTEEGQHPNRPMMSPPLSSPALPSPGIRSLTQSPGSQSRSAFASPIYLPSPTTRVLASSSTLALPPSPRTPGSDSRRSYFSSLAPSPTIPENDFISHKPHVPVSVPISASGETDAAAQPESGDGMAFESIPLSSTPPKPTTSAPLPSSPRGALNPPSGKDGKRRSWNGFGAAKGDKASKRSSWINGSSSSGVNGEAMGPPLQMAKNGSSEAVIAEEAGSSAPGDPAEPSEKPRIHAPPAHPHPFPLPSSSPLSSANKPLPAPEPIAGPSVGIGAKGLSAFEKIVNHTRPSHLPPKPKDEDDTHYHQWEAMMAQARDHEKERRKVQEARRMEKEKKLAAATPVWDALLNDPGFTVGKVKADKGLREMWFGGVPGYLRGKAWGLAIGNPLALSKDAYKSYVARARKALDSGRFPDAILEQVEYDLDRTLPQLKLFGRTSPMRADLHEFLAAWVVYRSDEGLGYAPYVSQIAAMLLLPSPPASAFLQLCNLLSRPCLRAFVTETKDEIEAFYRVFENLQADTFPKIFANCSSLGLRLPEGYFRSMLVEQVPFEACCRLWDQIVLDGDGYIFRSALAIFGFLEPRLHYPDKNEILSVLEGRNKATLAITEREKQRARLKGEAFDEELDGKLSVFGLNEDALFDWLATDGWKESRYERLVVREMPD